MRGAYMLRSSQHGQEGTVRCGTITVLVAAPLTPYRTSFFLFLLGTAETSYLGLQGTSNSKGEEEGEGRKGKDISKRTEMTSALSAVNTPYNDSTMTCVVM